MEPLYCQRDQENRIQQIGHGHVYDKKVDGFSHGLRIVDNYSDDGVPSQRNKKDETVSKGASDFYCSRIVAARWLCSIHRCVQVFRHSRSVSFPLLRSQISCLHLVTSLYLIMFHRRRDNCLLDVVFSAKVLNDWEIFTTCLMIGRSLFHLSAAYMSQ